uniref:B30.2/SPRY domain-containing protein n=1 Tax=Kryptolebias marmoratus TaxID=37003 RepID=A0A3Q3BC86_KRYMA
MVNVSGKSFYVLSLDFDPSVVHISEPKHKLTEPSKSLQENVCSRHDELMKMFCRTDQQCICYLCSVGEHKGHDAVSAAAERADRQRHAQQETEVSRVKELQEKLEQEITELRRKDGELEQLSNSEDHIHFLHSYPSWSALSESPHSPRINTRPLRYFEDVAAAVSELGDKLQGVLKDKWTDVSLRVTEVEVLLSQPEPKSRADFLKHSRKITLDPNTPITQLSLSEGGRKVTVTDQHQPYSDHPERFTGWFQVLSRESLTGCCYWEVEWRGRAVSIAVAYRNISRAGWGNDCGFGYNDRSWALDCPESSRVGVYLDHRAGILSFYSVSDTMTLLHRVRTRFTQPLHAGLCVYNTGDAAEFSSLK